MSGNSQYGGALFILPRELRDKIYQLLFKKKYVIHIIRCRNSIIAPRKYEYDFAILQVSKAVSLEARDILYSESIFRCSVDFVAHSNLVLSSQITRRLKNVEIDLGGLPAMHSLDFPPSSSTYQIHVNMICQSAFTDLTSPEIARNSLRIRLFCGPAIIEPLSILILERVKGLMRLRTLILEVIPIHVSFEETGWPSHVHESLWGLCKGQVIRIRQEVKETLEPTLGPATEGYQEDVQHLTFHPDKHAISSLNQLANV